MSLPVRAICDEDTSTEPRMEKLVLISLANVCLWTGHQCADGVLAKEGNYTLMAEVGSQKALLSEAFNGMQ